MKSSTHNSNEYVIIRLEGNKKKDKEPADLKENIYCNREIGEFVLEIPLKANEYILKNEAPKIDDKKGVFILEYTLDEKKTAYEYNNIFIRIMSRRFQTTITRCFNSYY